MVREKTNSITDSEYARIQDEKAKWQSSGIVFMLRQDFVLRLLGDIRGKRILDFGCGVGTLLRNISPGRGALFHGMDMNARAMGIASAGQTDNLRFFAGDQNSNSLPDAFYDTVICMEIIEHIRDEREVIAFLKRKLKPGGSVIVTVPSRRKELKLTHFRVYRKDDLRRLFEANGFRTTYLKSYGFPMLRLSLSLFERLNSLRRKQDEHEVMSMYFFGGVKKKLIYRIMVPFLRKILRLDLLFSPLDFGVGVVGRFELTQNTSAPSR